MTSSPQTIATLDLFAEDFSPQNARVLVETAQRAYTECTLRDAITGTEVLIDFLPDAIVIAFRGTDEIQDWIVDAEFSRTCFGFGGGEVHAGFYRAWLGVKEQLSSLATDTRPLFFTGHSLGGALAQLAAEWFSQQGNLIGGVYTFGAPRLWNHLAAGSYDASLRAATFNVVNECDPVPLLPPLVTGYRDAGNEIFLPQTGSLIENPFIGLELLDDLRGVFRSWRAGRLALLPNHSIARYAEKINALA